jgi:hypothetical protein
MDALKYSIDYNDLQAVKLIVENCNVDINSQLPVLLSINCKFFSIIVISLSLFNYIGMVGYRVWNSVAHGNELSPIWYRRIPTIFTNNRCL